MYEVIVIYGENEPWWFFEDWEEDIVTTEIFDDFSSAQKAFCEKAKQLSAQCEKSREKGSFLEAFWNEDEFVFCEDCDEDLQAYHGLMLLKNRERINEKGELLNHETIDHIRKAKCCKGYR